MLTASCRNCGFPKEPANYGDNFCPTCTTSRREAEQHFAAENPKASESDILYAGRQALMARAHHASRNFTDPRSWRK
jgi:uncharacterized Zn finger protein (UPF0148 family)